MELNYHHLRYFWAVAREGNLTRAAENLRVSQSAISVQIRRLEESIGHALFERRGRTLKLTPAGQRALDYADSIFDLGEELLHVLGDDARARRRTLRVGVQATLSRNFQVGFLGPLLNREDVALEVRSGLLRDLLQRLTAHQLDVVLTNSVPARDDDAAWVPHTIDEQPVSLIAHPSSGRPRSLPELLREERFVVPSAESSIRMGFDALAASHDVKPTIAAQVDDMAMLRLVARSHEGLSVIPPIVVQDELTEGSLVELMQLPGLVETFMAVTVPRRSPHPMLLGLLAGAQAAARGASDSEAAAASRD
ncbi:MAG: LysR family transcriptional regulator [Myxococcota bacterium]